MELDGKRVGLLVEDMYNEFELWHPYYRLQEAGAAVWLIGPQAGAVYKSKAGLPVQAMKGMAEVSAADLDGLLVPGGYAPDRMRRHAAMLDLVRGVHAAGKPVAAICHAGWVLASAGVVRGRRVTSFFSIKDDMVNAGARWLDQAVVVDGNLITSRQPEDLPVFMPAFIAALGGR
ncbi:MAG: type 1 glutamine amidotransferase domain-containing protein [Pseudomonadota bacterium]